MTGLSLFSRPFEKIRASVGTTVILTIPANRVVVDANTADATNSGKPNKADGDAIAA
jgi:hypothetical protein